MGRVKGGKVLTALSDQWRTHPQVLPCLYMTDLTFDGYQTFRSDSTQIRTSPKIDSKLFKIVRPLTKCSFYIFKSFLKTKQINTFHCTDENTMVKSSNIDLIHHFASGRGKNFKIKYTMLFTHPEESSH